MVILLDTTQQPVSLKVRTQDFKNKLLKVVH